MKPFKLQKQQGQVFVILAISLVMLIGAVGLAVDSGTGYLVKAKLNAAADAGSVAGARAVSQGANQDEQRAQAIAAVQKFFAANYPAGYLGSNAWLSNVRVFFDYPARGSITVKVDAQATVPVTFMRVMGFNQLDIDAQSYTTRKDLDMSFVVDTSGSMAPVAAEVRKQSAAFLNRFNPTTDRIGLMHFSNGAEVDVPIRTGNNRGFDRPQLVNEIKGYGFGGNTNSSEGFWHGRDQLNRIAPPDRSSLRVIVFFSDGAPNTFASLFKFKNPSVCNRVGAISTNDDGVLGKAGGLWDHEKQSVGLPGGCGLSTDLPTRLTANAIPEWYNAHNPTVQEFRVITNVPRQVTSDTSTQDITFLNVNRASRNLAEAMAARARAEGIHVFTLGLGPLLKKPTAPLGTADDTGENLLKCMANTTDALPRCKATGAGQPVGVYCYAATGDDLQPCFASLASEILRITR